MRRKERSLIDSVRSAASRGVNEIRSSLAERIDKQNENLRNLQSGDVDYPRSGQRSTPTKRQIIEENNKELVSAGQGNAGVDICGCPECGSPIKDEDVPITESNIKASTYYASVSGGVGGEVTSGSETTRGLEKAIGVTKRIPSCQNDDCVRHVTDTEKVDYVLEKSDLVETEKMDVDKSQTNDEEVSETAEEKQHQQQSQVSDENQKRQEQMKGMEQEISNDTQKDKNMSM